MCLYTLKNVYLKMCRYLYFGLTGQSSLHLGSHLPISRNLSCAAVRSAGPKDHNRPSICRCLNSREELSAQPDDYSGSTVSADSKGNVTGKIFTVDSLYTLM
jgi:hypothetical protein